MTKEMILSCLVVGVFALVKSGAAVNNTLKCYQCEIRGQDENACLESDFKVCPSNQAYDRCLTNFRKNESGHFIIKKCALAPCEFKDMATNTLFSTSCELDWSTSDCSRCCSTHGCNKNNSAHKTVQESHLTLIMSGVFLFQLKFFLLQRL